LSSVTTNIAIASVIWAAPFAALAIYWMLRAHMENDLGFARFARIALLTGMLLLCLGSIAFVIIVQSLPGSDAGSDAGLALSVGLAFSAVGALIVWAISVLIAFTVLYTGAAHRFALAPLLAAVAAMGPAVAQERTPERRLVQAFSAYCVGTAAEPVRVRAAIASIARPGLEVERYPDASFETGEILDSTGRSDPHQRMLIYFGERLTGRGRSRICQVNVPWAEKAKLVAEVVAKLSLADGTSSVIREGQYDTDLTRWTTRIGDTEAVVEFGMPTFAGAAGRALTLSVEGP
jgi:hypothetical protein